MNCLRQSFTDQFQDKAVTDNANPLCIVPYITSTDDAFNEIKIT